MEQNSTIIYSDHYKLSKEIGQYLKSRGQSIAVAESCTGGLISHIITQVDGSSEYYPGSVISYNNSIKVELLGVMEETLEGFGAISEQCVTEMASGVKELMESDWAVAISGIAGPDGGTEEKPVGLVYICIISNDDEVRTFKELFEYPKPAKELIENQQRNYIKQQACNLALTLLRDWLKEKK